MDPKIQEQLDEQEVKIELILQSVKKTQKYMQITFWATVVLVVLPMLLLAFAVPAIINTFSSTLSLEGLI
jgi:hypothetical protein